MPTNIPLPPFERVFKERFDAIQVIKDAIADLSALYYSAEIDKMNADLHILELHLKVDLENHRRLYPLKGQNGQN